MRCYSLFALGLLGLLVQEQSLRAQLGPLPHNDFVKLRLEIEIQGVLSVTEKSATLTYKETISEWAKNPEPRPGGPDLILRSRQVDKVWVLELDDNLKKSAKTLHGKQVVVTGKCLLLGIRSKANTEQTAPTIGSKRVSNPRGGPAFEGLMVVPGGIATSVYSQLVLDDHVTVLSLQAAKPPPPEDVPN